MTTKKKKEVLVKWCARGDWGLNICVEWAKLEVVAYGRKSFKVTKILDTNEDPIHRRMLPMTSCIATRHRQILDSSEVFDTLEDALDDCVEKAVIRLREAHRAVKEHETSLDRLNMAVEKVKKEKRT